MYPIVASRTSIHSRYYDDTILKYYDADNDEALAACIFSMWLNPTERSEQVARAKKYVDENNWEAKKAEYLQLVDRVASRDNSSEYGHRSNQIGTGIDRRNPGSDNEAQCRHAHLQ